MNWWNISCYLCVLVISCASLVAAQKLTDDAISVGVQALDFMEPGKGHHKDNPNFMSQLFSQPMIPSLSFDRSQSISHNIGYNLGRTVGRTPFMGASLDSQPASSKVVLVLANDTPETSALPQPEPATLKRLVRHPEFVEEFVSQMALLKDQISQKVPALSRTVGLGFDEVLSQAPILSQAQQTGAINYPKLAEAFGQSLLPENMFAGVSDVFNFTLPQNGDAQAPPSETEKAENELEPDAGAPAADQGEAAASQDQGASPKVQETPPQTPSTPFDSMLMGNPLFRNFNPFLPPPLPSVNENNPFLFNPPTNWPWLTPPTLDGAASRISEVRVKPEMRSPYKIAPREGVTQKMTEMKLRAIMKDALDKKTIPILWFHLPEQNDQYQDTSKILDNPMSKTDEDLRMKQKLEAFEKQLILELQQLQEVVKLANAMKKAQLESKGKKYETTQPITPLALSNTPVYKITLDDIEKTLKDEYVQKLLQMISNSHKREEQQRSKTVGGGNTKYATDIPGSPYKRQTSTAGTTAASLSREDMVNMMSYAYRMAAAKGQEMPWLKEDNVQRLDDQSKSTQSTTAQQMEQRQQMEQQTEKTNEQQWLMEKQRKMAMEAEKQGSAMAEERHHKHGGHHHSHFVNPQFDHHHFAGRQSEDPQMRQGAWLTNDGRQQMMAMPQAQQMRQGGWLTNEGQQQMMAMSQDQQTRQGGWLTNEGQQQMMTIPQGQQMRQGGWLTNEGQQQMMTMPQGQQMRQGGWLTNEGHKQMTAMPQDQQMRQGAWLTNDDKKMATATQDQQMPLKMNDDKRTATQDQQMRQETNDDKRMVTATQDQQMRQDTNDKRMETATQDQQMRQETNADKRVAPSTQGQQMRQGAWLTNDNKKMATTTQDQQMRQGAWLTNDDKKMATKSQDQQMRQEAWLADNGPKMMSMSQGAGLKNPEQQQFRNNPMATEQRQWLEPNTQMKQPLQEQVKQQAFGGNEGPMQRFMENNAEAQQQQMRQMNMPQMAQQQQSPMFNSNPNPDMQMRQQQWGVTNENQADKSQGQQSLSSSNNAEMMANPQQRQQQANTGQQIDPQMQMRESSNEQQMSNNPPMAMNEQPLPQQRQMANTAEQTQPATMERQGAKQDERKTEQHPTMLNGDERQMANTDPGMPIANEAVPQMSENAGKARHKGLDDFFDDLDLFGHHDKKHKGTHQGTVVNYYYNSGGSRYPPVYSSYGGYGGGYAPPPSYGYGGGYGGGYAKSHPSYGGGGYPAHPYRPAGQYGGGSYHSNGYGSHGGYRTATGDDEIEEMLKEHQAMPKMMLTTRPDDDHQQPNFNQNQLRTQGSRIPTPTTTTSNIDARADLKNQTKSEQTSNTSEKSSNTVIETLTPPSSSSASPSASALSPPSSVNDDSNGEASSEHERSLFSFDSKILQPFMGLQKVDRKDDPWHHKPYNLYQPIFTGGGTFESLLNRYRRNADSNPQNNTPSQRKHVLTPEMLERLLRIKMNFEKNYPFLYKTMMGHLMGDKHTTLSITPPEIPEQVSYPNVELAAAEMNHLDPLLKKLKKEKYEEQLKQLQEMWSNPAYDETYKPLINSYNDEQSFWNEVEQQPVQDLPRPQDSFWQQFHDSGEVSSPMQKRESFWSALEEAEERQNQQRDRQLADDLDRIFNFDDDDDDLD